MNSRTNNVEDRISDLEARIREITQSGQQTESQMGKKSNVRDLLYNKQWANLCITGTPKGGEREKGIEMYLKKLWLKISES